MYHDMTIYRYIVASLKATMRLILQIGISQDTECVHAVGFPKSGHILFIVCEHILHVLCIVNGESLAWLYFSSLVAKSLVNFIKTSANIKLD